MSRIRSKDTKPEMVIRRLVFKMGYRYRLHRKELPGKPDLVFKARKKVIFVHGCFWHQHTCKISKIPKSNIDYWIPKLTRNKERDKADLHKLTKLGWSILIVWECELNNIKKVQNTIKKFLGQHSGEQSPS